MHRALTVLALFTSSWCITQTASFTLPDLPYSYDALEPYIDAETMRIHHLKHHDTYVTSANRALKGMPIGGDERAITDLQVGALYAGAAIRNYGGGHYNHALFWVNLVPPANSGEPSGALKVAIETNFGSLQNLQDKFNHAAETQFGSGWAWLGVTPDKKLAVTSTKNQDNPLMDGIEYYVVKMIPILGLDVWEHAYYLKYQNKRPDYIRAFWHVVNWNQVTRNFEMAMEGHKVTPISVPGKVKDDL